MDLSSGNHDFGVIAPSGGTFGTSQTGTCEASAGRLSASLPISSTSLGNLIAERATTAETSMNNPRRTTSQDFAEQIRQLEIEGNKLRSATVSALAQGSCSFNSSGLGSSEPKLVTSPLTTSLASLVDISAEQKTIADLRAQLENQRRETERLQSHLLRETPGHGFSSHSNVLFSSPIKPAFSTNELASNRSRAFEYVPPSHLERALKESQEQVAELQKKFQDALENAERQKHQFIVSNEELKAKLHETLVNRDTVLDLRQKESANQEAMINKLQSSLAQLQERYQAMEKSLADMNKLVENSNQSTYSTSMAMSQLRAILAAREQARGHPFVDKEPVGRSQSAASLILMLEKCLLELDQEVQTRRQKVKQFEKELEYFKKMSEEKELSLMKEHQERLRSESEEAIRKVSTVTSEQERRLEEANERAANARNQASNLQEQLNILQEQHSQQSRMKNETISELESKLKQLKEDYEDDRCRWVNRRQALETSLDDVQRELIQAKAEKAEAIRNQSATETKADDLQLLVNRLEGDLETERERVRAQREREEELRLKVLSLEGQITHKQQEVERLERMLEVVKQEASVQVVSAEKQERGIYVDQISHLTSQLTSANEAKMKLAVESERARIEAEALRQQLNNLKLDLQSAQEQVEAARSERELSQRQLHKVQEDFQREREQAEHYRRSAEQKAGEAEQLRSTVERVTIQLEEKEKVLNTVRQQSTSISNLMEANCKTNDNMREERDWLASLLEAKTAAYEQSRAAQDDMSKKMKLREKRIREMEDEKMKLMEEMGTQAQELSLLQQEKENIFAELKDSQVEVSKVMEVKDNLRREMSRLKTSHTKEIDKLHKRLKEAERDFKLTHRALKTKDLCDSKAVKVADKIQKEITAKRSELDNLRSKVRRLEENIETVTKERLMVERDKDSLKASLARSLLHTSQLTEELEASRSLTSKLQKRNKELEDALEKEAIKCASTEAQLEQFDQEVATLKLRHQLDLKEAAQLSQKTSSQISWVPVKDSMSVGSKSSEKQPALDSNRTSSTSAKPGSKMVPKMNDSMKGVQESYTEAGKELKSLLAEMKDLIHGQREINMQSPSTFSSASQSSPLKGKPRSRSTSPDKHHQSMSMFMDGDPSFSMSYPPRSADASAFSAVSASRSSPPSPRRGFNGSASWRTDTSASSFISHGSQSDVSNISASFSVPVRTKDGEAITLVPDTQELCRRLEEKIANLTRMGSNLQHENQEMAQLISAQGQKLNVVRKNERQFVSKKKR